MASLRRRNGTFYAQWHDASRRPKTKRHSLKTKDERTARRLLASADHEYRIGAWDPWVQLIGDLDERPAAPVKLEQAVTEFLAYKRQKLQPVTLENYESMLRRFASRIGGNVPLARLLPADVEAFACASELRKTTQQTRLTVMRSFFSWALRVGHVRDNTARRVEPPIVGERLPRIAREEDLALICEAVHEDQRRRDSSSDRRLHTDRVWLIPCFQFAFATGFRPGELSRLTWGDVDIRRRRVRLDVQKNKKAQYLPLSQRAVGTLPDRGDLDENDFVFCPAGSRGRSRQIRAFATNLNAYFREYAKQAGISRRVTLHGLRHGFCTHLAESGAEAFVIQAAARHGSVRTSQVYVSIAGDSLRQRLDEAFSD